MLSHDFFGNKGFVVLFQPEVSSQYSAPSLPIYQDPDFAWKQNPVLVIFCLAFLVIYLALPVGLVLGQRDYR